MYFTVKINGKDLGQQFNANSKADVMDYLMIGKLVNPSRDTIEIEEIDLKPETGKLIKGKFLMDFGDAEILRHLNNLVLTYSEDWVREMVCQKFNLVPKRQRKVKAA